MDQAKLGKISNTATTICLWHCMLMPLLIGILPSLGFAFLLHDWIEWSLLGLATSFGLLSLCWGFRSHKDIRAIALMFVAVCWFAMAFYTDSHYLSIFGGLFMMFANLLNARLCRSCKHCDHYDK